MEGIDSSGFPNFHNSYQLDKASTSAPLAVCKARNAAGVRYRKMNVGARNAGLTFLDVLRRFSVKSESRAQVQAAINLGGSSVSAEWENANPYEAIPGPKPLPIPKGNIWRFLPFGTFYNKSADELHQKLFSDYGPIVKLSALGPKDVIILFNPEDTEKMFRNESSMPIRKGLMCLEYYRNVHRKELFGGYQGLVTSEGEEWYQFRTIVNQPMVQPRSAKLYIEPVVSVAHDFIERIKNIRDANDEMPEDFLHEINKWALESITTIALDTRFGCLTDDLPEDSDALRMVRSVKTLFDVLFILEAKATPWRYVWTPSWGKFVEVLDTISEISLRHINRKWEKLKEAKKDQVRNPSVLENILLRSENHHVAFTMAMDMLLAGVDTTSSVLANVLYHLAKNKDKQDKLFKELRALMPGKDHVFSANDLNDAKYLKACVKEANRLTPIVIGTQRETVKDIVLSNYKVPKGTLLVCNNAVMCKQEKHFREPTKYIPERWLKTEDSEFSAKHTNPFVYLPFGFGPRTCIGRRFAELELHIMTSKIIRNFKLDYAYGDMTWKSQILNIPNKPLKFKMEDRPDD